MHFVVVGLNHRTAPIELRERLTFSEAQLPEALKSLASRDEIGEAAILSTCNRTEVYASVAHTSDDFALRRFLADYHRVPLPDFESHLYVHHDVEAARHLFRVSAGIDSLVVGEAQILKQVRDGFGCATEAGCAGNLLNGLFRAAIATGKRARTETDISRGGFSMGHAAVDLAKSIFGTLRERSILILGAGKMSELTAKHLVASGVGFVMVANRTFERAEALAARLGGRAVRYDRFADIMAGVDIVISSTAAPHTILERKSLSPIMRKRRGRPLFLIDIAVPRDIAPDVAALDNVFLYDVDDLEDVVADMAQGRAGEVSRVEELVEEEVGRFLAWWRSLDAAPLVTQLKAKHEDIRQSELTRLRNQLPDLQEHAWQRIEAATRSMMNRVTRDPITRVKSAAIGEERNGTGYGLLEAAREIFALDEAVVEAPDTGEIEAREESG